MLDMSSPDLYRAACTGQVLSNVTIHFCKTDKELHPIMKWELTDVIVTSFVDSHFSNNKLPLQQLSLNFVECVTSYMLRDVKNKEMPPKRTGYSMETAKVI